jgi:NAD(P)-dependent dehydrogenase (short-subunit alcohol dehydrogenase family)
MPSLLLFGAKGAIGSGIRHHFTSRGWKVTGVTRAAPNLSSEDDAEVQYDPLNASAEEAERLAPYAPFDAVVWAQGANLSDSVYTLDIERHLELYAANCLFILASLQTLLAKGWLRKPARLCVVSSIWQEIAKQNKLSYGMTKAALKGLVLSASADLAAEGHLINAVLPGALETPMTRANLNAEQVSSLERATLFGRLPAIEEVAYAVWALCSPENTGLTGQFVTVDLGYSHVRIV